MIQIPLVISAIWSIITILTHLHLPSPMCFKMRFAHISTKRTLASLVLKKISRRSQTICLLLELTSLHPTTLHRFSGNVFGPWSCPVSVFLIQLSFIGLQFTPNILKSQTQETNGHPCLSWSSPAFRSLRENWTLMNPARSPALTSQLTTQSLSKAEADGGRAWQRCVGSELELCLGRSTGITESLHQSLLSQFYNFCDPKGRSTNTILCLYIPQIFIPIFQEKIRLSAAFLL